MPSGWVFKRNSRGNLHLGHIGDSDVAKSNLVRFHTCVPLLKPTRYFLWKKRADYVSAEGGAGAALGQEVGVVGGDEDDFEEALLQAGSQCSNPIN